MTNYEQLRQDDLRSLWHPYTHINVFENAQFPIIKRAQGVRLYDVNDKPILDGISSWWCVNLGHGHPRVLEAIHKQVDQLQHTIMGNMSHDVGIELSRRLVDFVPEKLTRAYFASDGASAVEAALRMALQYWSNLGEPKRKQFVALKDAYHGDTLGAVSVGYLDTFHAPFKHAINPSLCAESPHCFHCPYGKTPDTCGVACFESLKTIVESQPDEIAGVIVEPICQGAAGMRIYPAEYLRQLRALCDKHKILLIADEIAVGFGRTGQMFACEHAGITPDIMCIGKGLTAGYLPMSAAVVTEQVFDAFRDTTIQDRTFYHGHTFAGNPICSAAAVEALKVYEEEQILESAKPTMQRMAERFAALAKRDDVSQVKTLGMMGVLEIAEAAGGAEKGQRIKHAALEAGLLVRPLDAVVYLWPPLVTTPAELDEMVDILESVMSEV